MRSRSARIRKVAITLAIAVPIVIVLATAGQWMGR